MPITVNYFSVAHCASCDSFSNQLKLTLQNVVATAFTASVAIHVAQKCNAGHLVPWLLLMNNKYINYINCSVFQLKVSIRY